MKNTAFYLVFLLFILIGCEKQETTITITDFNSKLPKDTAAILSSCPCGSRPCNFTIYSTFCECSKLILDNKDSRSFVINWKTNCCGGGYFAPSYGKICYTGNKNELYVEITNNIPICLQPCYSDVACLKATVIKCNSKKNTFYVGWNDSQGNYMELTNEDIRIKLTCKQNNTTYECEGTVQWQ